MSLFPHFVPAQRRSAILGLITSGGEVRLQVRFKKFVWIEDLIKLVEESASSEVS